ncbi:rhomboid family intramembrane serine protease [Brachybacterium hainanense]|uniref:Rhomboid family intramembrane serine protease n=1 Tax=Brachybacterium hainanense TaxID=1541174 RepID=A0ABV6R6D3_9MICO
MNRPSYGYSAAESEGAGEQPVCPRHPDQVTYVRCQRCDRPVCGQCQRPAAVGVLCVDCEHQLRQQQRSAQPRTAMGAPARSATPYVTYVMMGLCGLGFLLQQVDAGLVYQFLVYGPVVSLSQPWTFLTSGFLHGGIMHIALNMWALWAVGQYLERTMGHWRYAGVYLVSVIAGHTAVLLFADPISLAWTTGTVGASGGIFGLFGSLFVVNRRMGAQATQVLILIGLNLVITVTVPGISWQGHLGGLVVGTAMTAAMFALRPRATPGADRIALARRASLIHVGVIGGGLLLCLLVIAAKAASVPAGYLPLPFA